MSILKTLLMAVTLLVSTMAATTSVPVEYRASPNLIRSCGYGITTPGYYYLNSDLTVQSGICVLVRLSHPEDQVTVDCQGYTIRGTNLMQGEGISHGAMSGSTGTIHVRNCRFENMKQPISIYKDGGIGSSIENNVLSNTYFGILVGSWSNSQQIRNVKVSNNVVTSSSNGLAFHNVVNGKISGNEICSTPGGYFGPYNVYCSNSEISGTNKYVATNCNGVVAQACPKIQAQLIPTSSAA